jgi:O-antigen biosynthesis protein
MSKTVIGMVTFGGIQFSKLTIESIQKTTTHPISFFVIVGKPGDDETIAWLREAGIPYKVHDQNYGFPYSINDIYDYAWKNNDFDNLIIVGNDIVAYPYCIDSMIELADNSDYEVISALQYDVRSLTSEHPETQKYFTGDNYRIDDFSSECWNIFTNYSLEPSIAEMQLYDIQNCCLYKRSVFNKVGYIDIGFFPAYYADNDFARRIVKSGIHCCSLSNARFFHFWSRTIKQGSGGSTHKQFDNNRRYYIWKWGGDFGQEKRDAPVLIDSRVGELQIINYWKSIS